jgi:integrase/recombinase XerC
MTAQQTIGQFTLYLEAEKRYSQHTVAAYSRDLEQFMAFGEITSREHFREANHQLIRGWMVELLEAGVTARSVNRKLSCLRSFFNWLKRSGITDVNPMLKIRGPKTEKRLPEFVKQTEFTRERVDTLFADDFEGWRDRLMLELFYQTGIRRNELLNLRERDVTETQIKVLGKRNKERIIPISKDLVELIGRYRQLKPKGPDSQDFLFVKKDGIKLYPEFVYRKINTYLGSVTNVGKKSPHVLRHTFATHMLNNGAGLETLKELLGHANLSATQVYTHNSFAQINNIYSQAHPRGRKN